VSGALLSLVAGVVTAKVKHVPIPAGKHSSPRLARLRPMATDLLDIADRLWRGESDMDQRHLFGMGGALADLRR
jgi:hypothetical protein